MKQYFENPRLSSPGLKRLVTVFMSELVEDYEEFLVKFTQNDYESCLNHLHKIKGSALTFGIQELAEDIQNLHSLILLGNYTSAKASILQTTKLIEVLKSQAKTIA